MATGRESGAKTYSTPRKLSSSLLERKLQVLVGLALNDMWRPGWQDFEFGPRVPFTNRKGETFGRPRYTLGVFHAWSISRGEIVVLGSNDHGKKRRFYDRKTPPADGVERGRWARAREFLDVVDEGFLVVESVTVGPACAISITLSDGYAIRTVMDSSDPHGHHWIFWDHKTDRSMHVHADQFVVSR